jgi:hypothetical protein
MEPSCFRSRRRRRSYSPRRYEGSQCDLVEDDRGTRQHRGYSYSLSGTVLQPEVVALCSRTDTVLAMSPMCILVGIQQL